jgi:hypothetical protein
VRASPGLRTDGWGGSCSVLTLPLSLASHTVSAGKAQEAAGLYAAPSSIRHSPPALLTWGPAEALQVRVAAGAAGAAGAGGAVVADLSAAPVLAPAAASAVSVPAAGDICLRNSKAGHQCKWSSCSRYVTLLRKVPPTRQDGRGQTQTCAQVVLALLQ